MASSQVSTAAITEKEDDAVKLAAEDRSTSEFNALLWRDDWSNISGGIVLAAFAYPFVLLASLSLVLTVVWLVAGRAQVLQAIVAIFVVGMVPGLFAAFFGMIWAGIVNACITHLLHAVIRSLELRPTVILYGAFKGGLVGFLSVLPLGYFVHTPIVPMSEWAGPLLFGPCLATIVGQAGGAWGGRKANWYERAIASSQVAAVGREVTFVDEHAARSSNVARVHFRFGVRHMLWVTTWLSVLLALIRLAGIPFYISLAILFGWLLFQSLTLWLGGVLVRWLGPWWIQRRQGRST